MTGSSDLTEPLKPMLMFKKLQASTVFICVHVMCALCTWCVHFLCIYNSSHICLLVRWNHNLQCSGWWRVTILTLLPQGHNEERWCNSYHQLAPNRNGPTNQSSWYQDGCNPGLCWYRGHLWPARHTQPYKDGDELSNAQCKLICMYCVYIYIYLHLSCN